jgi:hypothetical protein
MAHPIAQVLSRFADQLRAIPGVTGLGVGPKLRACRRTGELSIHVFVERKLPPEQVPPAELIPSSLDGYPTDVTTMGRASLDQEEDPPPDPAIENFLEQRRFRSGDGGIHGGTQIYTVGGASLGCMLKRQVPEGFEVLALTNAHVANELTLNPGKTIKQQMETTGNPAGQPDTGHGGFSGCSSNVIGSIVDAKWDEFMDAAIAKLDPGLPWSADIEVFGAVTGTRPLTETEVNDDEVIVRKYGRQTLFTRGLVNTVLHHGQVFRGPIPIRDYVQQVLVYPLPPFVAFTMPGDSGSVYVDRANKVVALHAIGTPLVSGTSPVRGGAGAPIETVLQAFDAIIATATSPGQEQTVPELSAAGTSAVRTPSAPLARPLARAFGELSQSPAARDYLAAFDRHEAEVRRLINERARVAAVWRLHKGAALTSRILSAPFRPNLPIFGRIGALQARENLDAILDVLARYGSAGLRADIAVLRPLMLSWASISFNELVDHMARDVGRAASAASKGLDHASQHH